MVNRARSSGWRKAASLAVAAICLGAVALPVSATAPASPSPASPALAVDIVAFDSNRTGNYELFTMRTDGTEVRQVTSGVSYDTWWPKLSPDRSKIMFVRTPKGVHDSDYTKITTWVMNSDGTDPREILPYGAYGWLGQGHPEWSPDGTKIATMCEPALGVGNVQICIVDADGSNPRQVTSRSYSTSIDLSTTTTAGDNRGGINVDPSWHPDGQSLLFSGCPVNVCVDNLLEIYRIGIDGRGETRLTNDLFRDHDAYYAPDGNTIAWLRQSGTILNWGIMRMNPDASGQRFIINDGGINSKPGWSVDSQWIFFHRAPVGVPPFNVWKIRPDGTALTQLAEDRAAVVVGSYDNEYPVNSPL